jgi:hypothetical protein
MTGGDDYELEFWHLAEVMADKSRCYISPLGNLKKSSSSWKVVTMMTMNPRLIQSRTDRSILPGVSINGGDSFLLRTPDRIRMSNRRLTFKSRSASLLAELGYVVTA